MFFFRSAMDTVPTLVSVVVGQIYVSSVMQMIEMSPVNSDLQLAALRLLTNLSVTDNHQHLMKKSITLLLSLLVVSNEVLQVINLSHVLNDMFR